MTRLIVFILATTGLTHIVVYSRLFRGFREWLNTDELQWLYRLFTCPKCFGTWAGLFEYVVVYEYPIPWLVYPFIGSIAAYTISLIIAYISD